MESTTEQGFLQAKSSANAVIYRAVGWVAGTYQPGEDDVHQGIFITEDGLLVPSQITWQLRGRLKHKNPEYATQQNFFNQPWRWTVYPKTDPLQFELTGMGPLSSEQKTGVGLDNFCVVGEVKIIEPGVVTICIQRNQGPRWRGKGKKQLFNLTLAGSLPEEALAHIWQLTVRREGEKLTVVDGQTYQPSSEDLVWLEQQQRQATRKSNLPAPILKQHPAQMEDKTIAAPKSPAVVPAIEAKETPDVPQVLPSAGTQTTLGKMEVVVKLNQFPDDVRTLDKGWREFEVDTGNQIVTITVKPKAFAALEQAPQSYRSWVAAISGQMGEMTATGFRLESPSIKVFERKAKNSSQSEETTDIGNLSQPPATEPKLEPGVPNPTQRPGALHKQGLQQQPSSSTNPTTRIKQPEVSKTASPPGQQQQRVTSEQAFVPQPASPTPKAETTNKRLE